MAAIKAGILTATTKAEAERTRLLESLQGNAKGLRKIVSFLPNAEARYRQLVANLERLPQRYVAEARQELSALVGGAIRLMPTAEGYLEAHLVGHYAGLVKLAVGLELDNNLSGAGLGSG